MIERLHPSKSRNRATSNRHDGAELASGCERLIAIGVVAALVLAMLAFAKGANAQTPEEHASHHPDAAAGPATAPTAGMGNTPAPAGGMGDMGNMMEGMGKPPPQALYPSLMSMPEESPERRGQVLVQAGERMKSGTALLGTGLDRLNQAVPVDDYAGMQEALAQLRQGVAQLESGVAAHRALAEGKPGRQIAMEWFRGEMNLNNTSAQEPAHGGVSVFHLFTMALLIAFAIAMLLMYYFKMRRAAALFGRIDPDKGAPPPGSSPRLAGGSPPSAPPGRSKSPDAKPSSPASPDKPPKSIEPPSDKAVAPSPPATPDASARMFLPLKEKWAGKLRVESIIRETPVVQTFRLRAPEDMELPFIFTPGQFLNLAFGIGGARMNRSYSISSSPNERQYVDLTIKREDRGAVSRHINDLVIVGNEIEAGGPVGKFVFTGTEADSVVFISAGVGITPMMCAARYLTEQSWPGDIFFIYSCRTSADYIFEKGIAELERRNPKLHVAITMTKPGPGWKGLRGRLTKEMLTQAVPDLASRLVYICGPVPMIESTKGMLMELGVSPENVKSELFGAVKPPPPAPGTTAKPAAAATGALVTFSKNSKSAKIHTGQTILELSEELGIGIEFSCRVGTCGVCKVKMSSGEVEQEVQDALDDDDKKNGIILACQAKPTAEVTVEA